MNSIEITQRLKDFDEMIANPSIIFSHKYVINHRSEYAHLSIATFKRDIEKLRNIVNQRYENLATLYNNNLLKNDRKSASYYYADKNIRAFDDLNQKESQNLIELLNTLIHLFPGNDGLIQKISAKIKAADSLNDKNVIHWDPLQLINDGERSGSQHLKDLLDVILHKQAITINYFSKDNAKKFNILPVLLKEYHNGWYASWYLLGMELESNSLKVTHISTKSLRCFALEKIISISKITTSPSIKIKPDFNPSNYFKDVLGIWRNNLKGGQPHDPQKTEIKFLIKKDSWIKNYIAKHPIHYSQVLNENNNGSINGYICVEETADLVNLFVKYADQFTVIEPIELRQSVIEILSKSLESYNLNIVS